MKTVKVKVTQEDIDKGLRGNVFRCAINHALFRAIPLTGRYMWVVGAGDVSLHGHGVLVKQMTMPDSMDAWRCAFDADKTSVAPFSFKIDSNGIHV